MVFGPQNEHFFNKNYHPENPMVGFWERAGEREVSICPFHELIELCGEMVEIDVVVIGRSDHYCGSTIRMHDYPGSLGNGVYMVCQQVAAELQRRLHILEEPAVTDGEISRLREMTPAERKNVAERLNNEEWRTEYAHVLNRVYSDHHPEQSIRRGVEWAKEKLTELQEKATGTRGIWDVNCPQAPKDEGPMIRYASASGMDTNLLP